MKINNTIILSLISLILIPVLYWDVLVDLVEIWGSKEEYSHGYIIPFVALFFLWQKKEVILASDFSPSWIGVIVCLLAISIYFVGIIGDGYFLLRISLILFLIGIALAISGIKTTLLMLIPILLLIFSFPLPPVLQAGLTAKLQLISSQLGVSIIRSCDIAVFLEGNVIDLGNYKLQVVEACSGLRYLFPLMSLAFICAYMYQVVFWKRAIVFLISIPVTVLMNSFRIGIIGILVDNWGISMAEGFIHDFEGWVVFMACFVVLYLTMWVLSKKERSERGWENVFGLMVSPIQGPLKVSTITQFLPLSGVLMIIIVAITIIKPLGDAQDIIPIRKDFSYFPTQLANWIGRKDSLDKETIDFLRLSDHLLIDYKNEDNQWVNFYIAYYESQKHGAVPHSPKLCIPGGGWMISDIGISHHKGIEFNRAIISKNDIKQLVYYWYRQRGQDFAGEYYLKWNTFTGSYQHQRTDGALIRLTTMIQPNEAEVVADQRLKNFMALIDQELLAYIPN